MIFHGLVELVTHDTGGVQLSGIGPAETLEEFGVPMHADLPVGESAHVRLCPHIMLLLCTYFGQEFVVWQSFLGAATNRMSSRTLRCLYL